MLPTLLSPAVYKTLLPRPRVRTVEFAARHVPAPSIIRGNVRWDLFPFMREVLECLDSPDYDIITMQFAARIGKTTGVQAWLLKEIATNPHNGLWAEPDEPSLKRVLARTWKMIDGCRPCSQKAAHPKRRSNKQLAFDDCVIFGAYSGSPATAADEAAYRVVLNELDKFRHRRRLDRDGNETGEADFPDLAKDRATGWPGAKIVQMSTPSIKGRSRIESELLAGDRRRFYVPCPHCNHFQTLRTGRSREEAGGIKFDKDRNGKLDVEKARETAYYQCEKCRKKILDQHRYDMINAGKWIKEGQSIDKRGRIRGTPLRAGRHASFGPLGTHYSLLPSITWGWIAAQYVNDITSTLKSLQNYVNSIEGETWDPAPRQTAPHELAERLKSDIPRGQIPDDACFLTLAADTGVRGSELVFYGLIVAWRNDGTGHVVDWFEVIGEEALWKQHARWSAEKLPLITGIDSGGGRDDRQDSVSERIYQICRDRRNVYPTKGSTPNMEVDWFSWGIQRAGLTNAELTRRQKRKSRGGGDLFFIGTARSQGFRVALVEGYTQPGERGFVSLPAEVAAEPDAYEPFLEELCSDYFDGRKWTKRTGTNNEFGDCLRGAAALAEFHTRGGKLWGRLPNPKIAESPRPARGSGQEFLTPDGQPFFIMER